MVAMPEGGISVTSHKSLVTYFFAPHHNLEPANLNLEPMSSLFTCFSG